MKSDDNSSNLIPNLNNLCLYILKSESMIFTGLSLVTLFRMYVRKLAVS